MAKVTLDDGRVALVGVSFGEARPELNRPYPGDPMFRTTKVRITLQDENGNPVEIDGQEVPDLEGVSYCAPTDQFNRIQGRKHAIRRAFDQDKGRKLLSKKDRAAIVASVLRPMFEKNKKRSQLVK